MRELKKRNLSEAIPRRRTRFCAGLARVAIRSWIRDVQHEERGAPEALPA